MNNLHCKKAGGFSLPEVTIAVGIAALGLITLLGLMPQGLEMARKTGELGARRHIVEQITRDLEQTSWADLQALVGKTGSSLKYFDDQGIEVPTAGLSMSYVVNVEVHDLDSRLPQGAQPSDTLAEQYLRKVVIKIATSTNQGFDFKPANSSNYATFHTYIAKSR